jgi:ketosteroid isomerase-like protein
MERLESAINAHDLDALVACFDLEVESVQPAHPARNFRGSEQVRRNWSQILQGVPDLRAKLLRCVSDNDEAWTEWHWAGTRMNGGSFEMRGVTVQRVAHDHIKSVRFYMEPVDAEGTGIAAAVREVVTGR